MTIKRVVIDSSAASPFRVSASGVDTDAAEFDSLLFDGNQPPLRLWGTGYVSVVGMTYNQNHLSGITVHESSPVAVLATPAGKYPHFAVMFKAWGNGFLYTPSVNQQNAGIFGAAGAEFAQIVLSD